MKARLLILFLSLCFSKLWSQDFYDYDHSLKYARHLFNTRQFNLAIEEYERALFQNNSNDSVIVELVKSYREAGKLNSHISRFDTIRVNNIGTREIINIEIAKALIASYDHTQAGSWMKSHQINDSIKTDLILANHLIAQDFKNAFLHLSVSSPNTLYSSLVTEANNLHFKKPWIAGSMSAIIPGTGKVYAGEWKDGLFSFVIITSTAFQAYRGFSRKGTNSVYGWAMGTLCLGFYSGNIYGACKSVKVFNKRLKDKISNRAELLFRDNL
jgi:hypothetical protein